MADRNSFFIGGSMGKLNPLDNSELIIVRGEDHKLAHNPGYPVKPLTEWLDKHPAAGRR